MNTQQLEELIEEERAVWLGERLFDLSYDELGVGGVWRYNLYGKRITINPGGNYKHNFKEWLSSPEGIDGIEQAMIARGYLINISYDGMWLVTFAKEPIKWNGHKDYTKAQATITAAAMALMQEEGK